MITIRRAETADAERLLEIYGYYVESTAITFEYITPSLNEFRQRIKHIKQNYPYLVIAKSGRIEGFAYAAQLSERPAYSRSCERTIYLDRAAQKCGMGRALYEALENSLRNMGILNLYACIAYPNEPDEYLTGNSAEFHEHIGFKKVGEFNRCGYKFGHWYNIRWMEKIIGEHP